MGVAEREDYQAGRCIDRVVETCERRVEEWRKPDPAGHCDISLEEREKTDTQMQSVLDLMRAYRRNLAGG